MRKDHIVVRAEGLEKIFIQAGAPSVLAVHEANVQVHAAELVLIIGPSGSGKTTLLSMLGGLIPPTAGRVEIAGQTLAKLTHSALSTLRLKQIGFVFQNFQLIDALSVLENVELPLNLSGIYRPRSTIRARQLLERLGLGARIRFASRALSGGEKQRLAIARAFANDPPLILADEPTGSLDSRAGRQVIELLRSAAREQGKAVLVVSHDQRIGRYANQILQMEDGRIYR